MVSVVSGSGLGLANSASAGLGGAGSWAQAGQGRAGEQVSVNAATGNLVVQNRDEFLAGVGADIALLRTYNSRGGWDGDNADGWRLGYYRRVGGLAGTLNTAGSSIRRIEADGFEATYTWRDGRYVSTDGGGAHDSLSVDPASGTATWTDGDTGATETYQADPQSPGDYRLVALTDPEGHQVRIEHDAQGLIRSLATWRAGATAASETVLLQYDANRRLTQVDTTTQGDGGTAATRTRVRYGYDDQGRLAAVHTDLSPEDRSVADGHVYSVHYTYDPAGRLRTLTQTDGSALTIDYDTQGRVHLLTDALGRATRFGYDDATRTTTVTDPLQQTTQLTHDAAGRLLQVRGAALGGPSLGGPALTQTLTYDADGKLATVTDAGHQTTTFAYDERGNLIRRTDPAGHEQEQRYDAANRLTGQTQYTTPDPDGAGPLLAGGALTTHHVYDTSAGLRRLRFTVSPAGRVTEHQYNALGQVATTLTYARGTYVAGTEPTLAQLTDWAAALSPADRAAAQRQTFAYDLRGQLATSTLYSGATVSGSTVTWTGAATTHYTHDPFGRLLQTIDPDGRTQARAYDGLDRLILSTDAAGTTVYRHDDALRQTTVQLASPDGVRPGLRTVSTYDTTGLPLSQARFDGTTPLGTTPLGTTRHFHDDAGRLRMSEDPTGARQWWLYDPAGRPVASIDALGHVSVTTYDAAGRVVRVTAHATPIATAALVDAEGRPRPLVLADLPLAAHADDRRQWQLHDAAGRLRYSVSTLGEVSEPRYDGTGRVVAQVQYARRLASLPAAGQALDPAVLAALPTDPQDRLTRSLYDADGLLRATLDAEGYLTEMRHDGAGRVVERIAYAGRVPEGQRGGTLAQLLTGAGTSTFDRRSLWWYDAQGRVTAELDAEGYFTAHTYSDAGLRTHTLRHARALTPAAALAARATSDPATLRPAGSPQDRSTAWAYDGQGRLETETASDGTVTRHTYDSQGRLTRTERALGTAEVRSHLTRYDAQGRITAELSAEGAAKLSTGQTQSQVDAIWAAHATTHAYDAAGRRIRSTDAPGPRHRLLLRRRRPAELPYPPDRARRRSAGQHLHRLRRRGRHAPLHAPAGHQRPGAAGRLGHPGAGPADRRAGRCHRRPQHHRLQPARPSAAGHRRAGLQDRDQLRRLRPGAADPPRGRQRPGRWPRAAHRPQLRPPRPAHRHRAGPSRPAGQHPHRVRRLRPHHRAVGRTQPAHRHRVPARRRQRRWRPPGRHHRPAAGGPHHHLRRLRPGHPPDRCAEPGHPHRARRCAAPRDDHHPRGRAQRHREQPPRPGGEGHRRQRHHHLRVRR